MDPYSDAAPTCSSVMTSIPTSRPSTWTTKACRDAPSCPTEQRIMRAEANTGALRSSAAMNAQEVAAFSFQQ